MPLEVGEIASNFKLPDYHGNFYSLSNTKGYKPLVFYRNTCPACWLTLPFVYKLYRLGFPQLTYHPDYRVSLDYSVNVVTPYLVNPKITVEFVSSSFVRAHTGKQVQELRPG